MTDATDVTGAEKASLESRIDVLQDAVMNTRTKVLQLDTEMTAVFVCLIVVGLAVLALSKTTAVKS